MRVHLLRVFQALAISTLFILPFQNCGTDFELDQLVSAEHTSPDSQDTGDNVDQVAPEITILSPAMDTSTQGDISLAGRCESDLEITLNINGSPLQTIDCTMGMFAGDLVLSVADGVVDLEVIQIDEAGNRGSSQVSIIKDSIAPVVEIESPGQNATLTTQTIEVTGSCESGAPVLLSGTLLSAPAQVDCLNSSFEADLSAVSTSGAYSLTAKQTDTAGNEGQDTITVNLSFSIPAPVVQIQSPAANSVTRTGITITGSCTSNLPVRVSGAGASQATQTSCNSGSFQAPISFSAGDGVKNIIVSQTNAQNTTGQHSRSFVLDTTPPSVSILSPAMNSTTSGNVRVSGTCETGLGVTITINGGSSRNLNCTMGMFTTDLTLNVADGTVVLRANQVDSAGNSGASQVSIIKDTPSPQQPNPGWGSRSSNRILYSGHSLLEPVPIYMPAITSSMSDSYNYNYQMIGGSPIRVRTSGGSHGGFAGYSTGSNKSGSNMNIINEVRNPQTIGSGQRYDTLVIAENHSIIPVIEWENTLGYLRQYHDLMISGNPQTRTFFYHTWIDINKSNPAAWAAHEKNASITWECVVSRVNESLQRSNRPERIRSLPATGALVDLVERVMAGQVPEISGSTTERMNRIFSDNVHVTQLGSYYLALVVYSATYGKSPVGTPVPSGVGISASLGRTLQTIAWNYVNAYYSQATNPDARSMSFCRQHTANNTCQTYYTLRNETQHITNCRNGWNNDRQGHPFGEAPMAILPTP